MASSSSTSSSFFVIEPIHRCETSHYSLNVCSLCGKRVAEDCDVFMYRGDRPFCSEECRCHQILRDKQASAKNRKALKDQLTSEEQQRHRLDVPVAT
ncbi:hypothetical protein EJB05_19548 [Eragrostis curvula]|uniref:FLZ-type domain-containing protein n=1 Tax=Eragrostis curvula TaxID=38414 RepID=A0A5J9UXN5_9POAL|nr:hypothetical protein EJB05_19548 [Eragrostis curvula]